MALEKFRAPALPAPSTGYSREYLFQLIRVLGVYFSQLDSNTPNQAESYRADNFFGGIFSGDGYGLKLPHVAASDSTDQVASANDTPTVVKWNTLDSGYNWTLNAPGSASPLVPGVYKITYSLQLINTANAIHDAVVWLRVNNVNLANSATSFSIPAAKNANTPAYVCGYSEATFAASAGDVVELVWATDLAGSPAVANSGVYLYHDVAQTTPYARPAIPSAIGSITFVSALP
jgi:hypothetical protein